MWAIFIPNPDPTCFGHFGLRIPLLFHYLCRHKKRLGFIGDFPSFGWMPSHGFKPHGLPDARNPGVPNSWNAGIFIISLWIQGSPARNALSKGTIWGVNGKVSLPRRYLDPQGFHHLFVRIKNKKLIHLHGKPQPFKKMYSRWISDTLKSPIVAILKKGYYSTIPQKPT